MKERLKDREESVKERKFKGKGKGTGEEMMWWKREQGHKQKKREII